MKNKLRISILELELIFGTVIFGALMCLVNSYNGYREFKNELEVIYGTVTEQFAQTAATYVNSQKIDYWLENGADEEWNETNERLIDITEASELVYVYVTKIAPDYKSRIYVFDTVNHKEKNSKIIELGYVQSLESKSADYIDKLRDVLEHSDNYSMFSYKKGGGHVTSAVPLFDTKGVPCAIVSVVKPMHEIKEYKRRFLQSIIIWALALTALFIVLYALFLYLRIIRPILFVTCWLGILTLSTGELKFANAGHNAPIIIQGGEIKYLTTKPNLMLAGMAGIPYTTHSTKLEKEDQLFIYTDGVTEATNMYNELYGENRLLTVMKAGIGKTPRDVLDIVRDDINYFVQDAPQFDDITMLEMMYKGR